jgi:hypothetical protein
MGLLNGYNFPLDRLDRAAFADFLLFAAIAIARRAHDVSSGTNSLNVSSGTIRLLLFV